MTSAGDLYQAYTAWCAANGEDPASQRRLGQALTKRGWIGSSTATPDGGIGWGSSFTTPGRTHDEPIGPLFGFLVLTRGA